MNRIVAWYDDRDNFTQYFYANIYQPNLVTHMHIPKYNKTFRYVYDDRNMLIAIETAEQRFYVATDQNGSPLAFFDMNGNIVKQIKRSPFGKIIKDTNPDFYVPIDFHGGLLDPNTKLVYINDCFYDSSIGQWMVPKWEKLGTELHLPTDVFIYRFQNNDPINRKDPMQYMNNLTSWLKLFGYDLDKMQGSKYIENMVYSPKALVKSPQLRPEFGVVSGLQCILEKVCYFMISIMIFITTFLPNSILG
jgi:RHS repeat-associated protein